MRVIRIMANYCKGASLLHTVLILKLMCYSRHENGQE